MLCKLALTITVTEYVNMINLKPNHFSLSSSIGAGSLDIMNKTYQQKTNKSCISSSHWIDATGLLIIQRASASKLENNIILKL